MMQNEFEELIGKKISSEEYKVVEYVYTWHPSIKDTNGKEQMWVLYSQFGMGIIRGMVPVAQKMEELDKEKRELKRKLALVQEREEVISLGDMSLEKAIDKVNDLYMKADTKELFEKLVKEIGFDADTIARARKMATVFKNSKGEYLKQYCFEEREFLDLRPARLSQVVCVTEIEYAAEFPDTQIVFDMLEYLYDKYPEEKWVAIVK